MSTTHEALSAAEAAVRALPWEVRRFHGVHRATGQGATLDYSLGIRGGADVHTMLDVDPGVGSMTGTDNLSAYHVDAGDAHALRTVAVYLRALHADWAPWSDATWVHAWARQADELEALALRLRHADYVAGARELGVEGPEPATVRGWLTRAAQLEAGTR